MMRLEIISIIEISIIIIIIIDISGLFCVTDMSTKEKKTFCIILFF